MKALQEGQYIRHEQYGFGVVTESEGDRTTIDFDLHGKKKFVTSLMAAELVSDTAPAGRRSTRRRKKAPAPAANA